MLIFKTWVSVKNDILTTKTKIYRVLLLFGIIPLFIWIDG